MQQVIQDDHSLPIKGDAVALQRTAAIPPLMSAVIARPQDGLRLETVPVPQFQPNEVLVRVMAGAVNPLDIKILAGKADHARQPLPAILGLDMAGVVVAVGADVAAFQEGDPVYGMAGGVGGHAGSLAEYMAADARLLARKSSNLTMRQTAALPLTFITAWEGLVDRAAVSAGQQVLVLGGAGGVGQMALQIARAQGALISATGAQSARTAIEHLGARYVDRTEPPEDVVARLTDNQGFDVVFDTGGGSSLDAAFNMVRRYGQVVSALGWGAHALGPLSFRAASYSGIFTLLPLLTGEGRAHHGGILGEATKLAEAGVLAPALDPRRFTLDTIDEAYRAVETGTSRGKIIVDVEQEPSS